MSTISVIVVASAAPPMVEKTLESLKHQGDVALEVFYLENSATPESSEGVEALLGELEAERLNRPGEGRAKVWNEALAEAKGKYVSLIDAGQIVGNDCYPELVAQLSRDPDLAGSYGRTAVVDNQANVRHHPDQGRTGSILNRLVEKKHYIASFSCVLFRKRALARGFNEIYRTPKAVFIEHLLAIAANRPFAFCDQTVVTAPAMGDDRLVLEELVKVFLMALYGIELLADRSEQKLRKRLARQLMALGKSFYREGDYDKAGRFISQAVEYAPTYFKGRRYQFLNFLKDLTSKSESGS